MPTYSQSETIQIGTELLDFVEEFQSIQELMMSAYENHSAAMALMLSSHTGRTSENMGAYHNSMEVHFYKIISYYMFCISGLSECFSSMQGLDQEIMQSLVLERYGG